MTAAETAILPLDAALLSPPTSLPHEEQARADLYALLAALLLQPPDQGLLSALAGADSLPSLQLDNPLEQAWEKLRAVATVTEPDAVREEFDALFISIGTPLINPYGSSYLAGFMMEKPLAALRDELALLGLIRKRGVGELEDHLGSLCEVMRILIAGTEGLAPRTLAEQRRFFIQHISPWYRRCLDDIRRAQGVSFYRHVADFSQAFFELEFQAFEMEEEGRDDACEVK